MARGKRWQMSFVSLYDVKYELNIYEEDYEGEVITLIGGATPFVTDEDDDESPFIPIRTQSATMRIMATEGLDVEALNPETLTSHYVELVEVAPDGETSGTVKWQGFMSPQTFSQPWNARPYELEFPMVSPLGLLETKNMDMNLGLSMVSLHELIAEALVQTGIAELYGEISFDEICPVTTPNLPPLLDAKVSRYNWFSENTHISEEGVDGNPLNGASYLELMEDIAQFLGYTIRERGRKLYFKAVDGYTTNDLQATQIDVQTIENFINDIPLVTRMFPNNKSFEEAVDVASTNHTIDVIPGKKKITIDADVNEMDGDFFSFDPASHDVIDSTSISETYDKETFYCKRQLRAFWGKDCPAVETRAWKDEMFDIHRMLAYPTSVNDNYYGAYYTDIDVYTQKDIDEGKTNYEFDSGIHVRPFAVYHENEIPSLNYDDDYAIRLRTPRVATLNDGWLCLNIGNQFYATFGGFQLSRKVNGLCRLVLGLRIGNQYWNGTNWTPAQSFFYPRQGSENAETFASEGSGQLITTKTLDMDCNCDGYMIPVPAELSGDVELRIFPSYLAVDSWGYNFGSVAFTIIKSVRLEYFPLASKAVNSVSTNTYTKVINKAFTDEEKTKLNIATSQNNKNGYAILMNGETPFEKAGYYGKTGFELLRPEEYLLNRMVDFYSHSARYINVEAKSSDEITVNTKLIDENVRIWYPLCESRDWREGTSIYKLLEIKES